jgi:hypothetical protein
MMRTSDRFVKIKTIEPKELNTIPAIVSEGIHTPDSLMSAMVISNRELSI